VKDRLLSPSVHHLQEGINVFANVSRGTLSIRAYKLGKVRIKLLSSKEAAS
jgi:hypothetical protein